MIGIRTIVKERHGRVNAESVDFQIQFNAGKVINVDKLRAVLKSTARGCHASYSAAVTRHHGRHSDVAAKNATHVVRGIKVVTR